MAEPDRPHEADQEWIKPLLTAAVGGIAVGPVGRDELIAAGRARLARRRVLQAPPSPPCWRARWADTPSTKESAQVVAGPVTSP